jgi:glucose/arabinose dehydrogenase
MRVRIPIALGVCLVGLLSLATGAGAAVSLQPIGTFDQPVYVTSPPGDPRLFVVERPGQIQILHDGTRSQFLDIHTMVDTAGERGLLSMAFDPNYASNGLFYVFFNDDGTAGATTGDIHIDEFRVSANPNVADPASRRMVMTIGHSGASNHNGGQLQFGKDGPLYISVGEAGNGANAQSLGNPLGKILRIDPHGAGQGAHGVPPDNPFAASPTPEIWGMGLRNPWRFSFDHQTGDLVIGDVGAGSREEIDFSPGSGGLGRGANYGWPDCEGFSNFPADCPGSVAPVLDYAHSSPCNAVIAGYVYRGTQVPELAGRFVYNDLCHPTIRSTVLGLPLAGDDRSEGIGSGLGSPTSFGEDSSCELYVTDSTSVEKLVSSNPPAVAPSCPATPVAKKRKCKKRHHKKKHRAAVDRRQRTRSGAAAVSKSHKKKKCKKRKKKRGRR